jgi:hypothetical protein
MGRGIGGFCPALVGVLASRVPLGEAIWSVTVVSYSLVVFATWLLPETKGKSLASEAAVHI